MPADSASTTIAVGTYEVDDPWRGNLTVLMEGGWQYTHGGIDYAISPSTAPNHHPGRLEGGPVLSGLQLLTLGRHRFVSLRSSDARCAQAFNYPHFPRFFSIFSRFPLDFWPCSLDSWRPDAENGRKMGKSG